MDPKKRKNFDIDSDQSDYDYFGYEEYNDNIIEDHEDYVDEV